MSNYAIRAEGLGKHYRLGERSGPYKSLRESLVNSAVKPFRAARAMFSTKRDESSAKRAFWALKDVSFEVKPGEVLGVIGRNGAGKSTLLKILSRITKPTAGRASILGQVGSLLEVGSGFHPELSGRDNVYLNGSILGMSRAEIARKFDEIVAFAEVEKFIDTPVKRYSSGMYLRLAFAVAAHLEPEILFIDEVLAVGDANFQKKCLGKMSDVSSQGRTILFVSHNMGAVSSLCSRAIHLSNGKLVESGPAREIVQNYLRQQSGGDARDLDRLRLRGYGERVRFTDIRVAGGGTTFPFCSAPRFLLRLESERDFDNLSIGATVTNTLGVPVGTLHTKEAFSIRSGETLELSLTLHNLILAPDRYIPGFSVGTGGGSSARHDLDIVIGEPVFEVLPVSDSDLHITEWDPWVYGSVVIADTSLKVLSRV